MQIIFPARSFLVCLFSIFSIYAYGQASLPQWTYADTLRLSNNQAQRVFLYIPPSVVGTNGIRGLVLASHTIAENAFVQDSAIRQVCNRQRLAIIYFYPSPFSNFGASNLGADTTLFLSALENLANVSGHSEIRFSPWLIFGHSTSSAFVRQLAYWKPERTFGAIVFKGGALKRPSWRQNNILSVPVLGVNGEFEEYGPANCTQIKRANYLAIRDSLVKQTQINQADLVTGLALKGEGHFAYPTGPGANLIAMFVEKAAQYRIPADSIALTAPTPLRGISPLSGWAADTLQVTDTASPAPFSSIVTTPGQTPYYWYFDEEMARAWNNYHALTLGKTETPIQFNNTCGNLSRINTSASQLVVPIPFSALPAGRNYHIKVISGMAKPNPTQDSIIINPATLLDAPDIWVSAESEETQTEKVGHKPYRVAIQQNQGGPAQTFSTGLPTIIAAADSVALNLTSSANLPIRVTIIAGPARLVGNTLYFDTTSPIRNDTAQVTIRFSNPGNGFNQTTVIEKEVKVTGLLVNNRQTHGTRSNRAYLYPNPVKAGATFQVYLPTHQQEIVIISATGKIVKKANLLPTDNWCKLSAEGYEKGVYIIKAGHHNIRLLVQ